MAVNPGTYDLTIQRRSDFDLRLAFEDSTDSAINLTGWTVEAQVWDIARSSKAGDFAVTYNNRSGGIVDIALTDTQTATFTSEEYRYDVLLTNPAGLKEYYLEGVVYMSQGYTA